MAMYAPDPATLASLQNTLSPAGVLTRFQADVLAREQELAALTAAAQQASQGATQAYQGAASAPVEDISPLDEGLNSLLGNIAATIAQDPSFRERAQEDTRTKRKNLMQKRLDNLAALRDNHLRMAEAAKQAGDYEREQKDRMKFESLSKTYDLVSRNQDMNAATERQTAGFAHDKEMEGMRSSSELANIRARGAEDRSTLGTRLGGGTAGGGGESVENWRNMVATGQAQMSQIPLNMRTAVVNSLAQNNDLVLPTKVRDTINSLSGAEGVLGEVGNLVAAVNTAESGGPLGLRRQVHGLVSQGKGFAQSDVDDATYDSTIEGFLAKFSRMTGEVGVLTEQDVGRARRLLPKRNDIRPVATRKLQLMEQFVRGQKERTIRNFTTSGKQLLGQWAGANASWFMNDKDEVFVRDKKTGTTGWISPDDPDIDQFTPTTPPVDPPKKKGR